MRISIISLFLISCFFAPLSYSKDVFRCDDGSEFEDLNGDGVANILDALFYFQTKAGLDPKPENAEAEKTEEESKKAFIDKLQIQKLRRPEEKAERGKLFKDILKELKLVEPAPRIFEIIPSKRVKSERPILAEPPRLIKRDRDFDDILRHLPIEKELPPHMHIKFRDRDFIDDTIRHLPIEKLKRPEQPNKNEPRVGTTSSSTKTEQSKKQPRVGATTSSRIITRIPKAKEDLRPKQQIMQELKKYDEKTQTWIVVEEKK